MTPPHRLAKELVWNSFASTPFRLIVAEALSTPMTMATRAKLTVLKVELDRISANPLSTTGTA
jgi:hypothetical protein